MENSIPALEIDLGATAEQRNEEPKKSRLAKLRTELSGFMAKQTEWLSNTTSALGDKLQKKNKEWQMAIDRMSLDRQLSKLIELSIGHKNAGLKPGDRTFVMINDMANSCVATFCIKYGQDPLLVRVETPGLKTLADLSTPEDESSSVRATAKAAIVSAFGLFLIGGTLVTVTLACWHNVYNWITR